MGAAPERGLAGALLDLHVALAPCVIGYGEIGVRLAASRLAPARFDGLARTFGQAARLKAAFWDMGLTPAG